MVYKFQLIKSELVVMESVAWSIDHQLIRPETSGDKCVTDCTIVWKITLWPIGIAINRVEKVQLKNKHPFLCN